MRFLSLDLLAYGPFTGTSLALQDASANGGTQTANLHIVYGPNEAGKSCTLRALSNVLYGIPHNTEDGFLHPYEDLRIGLTLASNNGPIRVVRRKGRANSLRRNDGSESIFPPAEWAALLPVAERDLFDRMFGVDHAEIARGGKMLLATGSDLGGLLFSAAGGVDRLRAVQSDLLRLAEEIFKKSGSKPQLNKAVSELKQAVAEMKQSQLLVSGYKQKRDAVEETEVRSRTLERKICEASLEEQRLHRLQQAFPLVAKRKLRMEQLEGFADSRILPADFEKRYRDAYSELRQCIAEATSKERDMEELRAKIEATPVAFAILDHAAEIDTLYQLSAAVRKGKEDGVRRRQSLDALRVETAGLMASIGLQMPLQEAAQLRVPDPEQKRIFTLSTSKKAVDQEVAASVRELERACGEHRRAREELAGLAEAGQTEELEQALAMVRPGRDLEEEQAAATRELAEAEAELARSAGALPGWSGSVEMLAALPAPLPETITEFQSRFLTQTLEAKRLSDDRAQLQREKDQAERDLRRIEREQEVPTEQDLEASRARRDGEWQTIREAWLAGVAVDGAAMASCYETAVMMSDQIADRLRREAARVSEKAGLLVSLERLHQRLTELDKKIGGEKDALTELQRDWELCWSETGVAVRSPVEMQSWLGQRASILEKSRACHQRNMEATQLAATVLAIRGALLRPLATINGAAVDGAARLAELVLAGRRAVSRQGELRQRRATLDADVRRTAAAIAELEIRVRNANDASSSWRCEWDEATKLLPVRRNATAEEVQVVLERITSLVAKVEEMVQLEDRVAKLAGDEEAFRVKVKTLVESAGLTMPLDDPFAAISKLNGELQQNGKNRELLKTFAAQLEEKEKGLERARERADVCRVELAELCKVAHADDPDALPKLIERSVEKRRLSCELAELEDHLTSFAGKEAIAGLVVELEAVQIDELPGRIGQLQKQLEDYKREKAECDLALGASRLELRQQEDASRAVQSAEEAEHLRSRIGSLTEEYVRLRLASRILANAVERFREKNQGPLLKTAARIFSQLTDGSFADLRVDWNDEGTAVLMGVRGGTRKQVGVEGMSEATRDQLFLALRLAYVDNYCVANGPVPFIADDVLMTFDDQRAKAALRALETLSRHTQVLLFTHHQHHLDLAKSALAPDAYRVHTLH